VMRNVASHFAEGRTDPMRIGPDDLPGILGAGRFEPEVADRAAVPGIATGLAWTPVGGEILFIESTRMSGNGRLILTGQLGDVMKESAQTALSLLKSRAASLGIEPALFERSDIHVHVPAGAIPKDGPSAGVAMFMSLVSLMVGRAVDPAIAMTGEISLRGIVLPVGGIREKVVAAERAGIKTVMLPARNRRDYDDIPTSTREQLTFVWLETVDDAMTTAMPVSAGG
jgi:ATP-dependent Lon protease